MIDPPAANLLEVVANALTNDVLPTTRGGAQHSVRVAANLCRIIARELESPDDPLVTARLCELLGMVHDSPSTELWVALDNALKDADPSFDAETLPLIRAMVERELAISKPTYLTGPA